MIKSIKLHNFQSHVDSEIELSPTLTSIVGLSDSGKSSFLRALNSVIYRGPFYMRNFTTDGWVEAQLSNACVRREQTIAETRKCPTCKEPVKSNTPQCPKCLAIIDKTVTSDKYSIDGIEKEKFGVKLPEFITDVLKFKEVSFVDIQEKLNFASQHQDMFFIGPTYAGGARNKILSCLVPDSDKVDVLLKKVGTDLQEKKILSEALMKDNISIDHKIRNGKQDYEEIISLEMNIQEKQKEATQLKNKVIRLKQLREILKGCYTLANELPKAEKISKNIKTVETYYREKFLPLVQKLDRLKRLSTVPRRIDTPVSCYRVPDTEDLEFFSKKLSRLSILKNGLKSIENFVIKNETEKSLVEGFIDGLKVQHNTCLGDSKCPLIDDKYCVSCLKKLKM